MSCTVALILHFVIRFLVLTGFAVSSYLKAYTPTSDQHIDPLPWPLEGIELQLLEVFWTDTPYTWCPSWEGTYKTKELTEISQW